MWSKFMNSYVSWSMIDLIFKIMVTFFPGRGCVCKLDRDWPILPTLLSGL